MTRESLETASGGDMLGHVRHELRTPLSAIIGYSELLIQDARELGSERLLENLEEIHRAGRLALNHVRELVQPDAFAAGARWEDLRDRVRSSLDSVLEISETLLSDVRRRAPEMVPDLENIRSACRDLRRRIRRLAGEADPGEPSRGIPSARKTAAAAGSSAEDPGLGTVLVVDDHGINRDLVSRFLEKEGYRVVLAESGRAALDELATDGGIDLVLLDVLMPEMDGYQVLRKIKEDDAWRHIPVILISALDDLKNVVRGIRLGAEDYLYRPFDPDLLRKRVETLIERKRLRDQEAGAGEEVGELGRTFREMADEIQRRTERLQRRREKTPRPLKAEGAFK